VPAAPGPAISSERLTKRYGEHLAVDDISFEVRTGEVFAFLGQNGAGKTTTVEIIETIRPPTSGTVTVLGMDVTTRKARHRPPHRRAAAGLQLVRQDHGAGGPSSTTRGSSPAPTPTSTA
jgi:ABC-type branched-subunit amino acid transport system ATPase component